MWRLSFLSHSLSIQTEDFLQIDSRVLGDILCVKHLMCLKEVHVLCILNFYYFFLMQRVEGCLPYCPKNMILDEVTLKCVYPGDCKCEFCLFYYEK